MVVFIMLYSKSCSKGAEKNFTLKRNKWKIHKADYKQYDKINYNDNT